MKNYLTYLLFACTLFSGCDWLDVKPIKQAEEEDLFSTEEGFKTVLIGAYNKLATPKCYGRNMLYLMPDVIAQQWHIPDTHTGGYSTFLYPFGNFDYQNRYTEGYISDSWLNLYNAVAQANAILDKIDSKQDIFRNGNYEIIKGEALAIRAFVIFDILRLWGPVPTAGAGQISVPYPETATLSNSEYVRLPYETVLEKIIRDLDLAEKYLENDPFRKYSYEDLNLLSDTSPDLPYDTWQWYRNRRFNYYAIKAIKARYYMWINNHVKALENARTVVEETNSDGTLKFVLSDAAYFNSFSRQSFAMEREHIVGFSYPGLYNSAGGAADVNDGFSTGGGMGLYQLNSHVNTAYEGLTTDIRFAPSNDRYWAAATSTIVGSIYNFRKYYGRSGQIYMNIIPVIRISEMYLIMAECLDIDKAREEVFRPYLTSRNVPNLADLMTDEASRRTRLEKEYLKEFYGEGQLLYFYKRLNYSSFPYPLNKSVPQGAYSLPVPPSQS